LQNLKNWSKFGVKISCLVEVGDVSSFVPKGHKLHMLCNKHMICTLWWWIWNPFSVFYPWWFLYRL